MQAPPNQLFVTHWKAEGDEEHVTFGEFTSLALGQAHQLANEGLNHGEPVVLVMPQGIDLMASFVGAMMLGAVPAIVASPTFKAEPKKYRHGLAGVTANLKAPLVVVDPTFPPELFDCVTLEEGARIVRSPRQAAQLTASRIDLTASMKNAFIQHSAGTTGLQKAVALDHQAVLRQLEHLSTAIDLRDDDRIYSWLPLYHDMGLITSFMLPLVFHLPVVMQSPTSWVLAPHSALELMSAHHSTLSWMPNFAFQFMARRVPEARRAEYDLSSVRLLINCAEPVRAQSIVEFEAAFSGSKLRGGTVSSSYAMAENVFAVTQAPPSRPHGPLRLWVDSSALLARQRIELVNPNAVNGTELVSSGRCLSGNQVRIINPAGAALADGQLGEVAIASDSLFTGYFNRADLSAKAIIDGWYHSGDLGFCWEGELFVVGRQKDLIIIAGRNIYPQDVEELVCAHPAIHDGRCVALGLMNPALGTEELFAVAEVEADEHLSLERQLALELSQALQVDLGVSLRRLFLKPRGWLVKSTAGKPARSSTKEKLLREHPELQLQGQP